MKTSEIALVNLFQTVLPLTARSLGESGKCKPHDVEASVSRDRKTNEKERQKHRLRRDGFNLRAPQALRGPRKGIQ